MHPAPMDIVFFGSGAFGRPTLEHLSRTHRLRGIVTQPDRSAGRGGTLTPTPIAQWAADHLRDVPILKPERVNDPQVVAQIRGWPAHAWVVIAFGQYLGRALVADRFAINLHGSLLPRWRGAAPIHAAVLAGDDRIGNSVITIAPKMDAGLILAQEGENADGSRTAGEWHDLLAQRGPALIERVLRAYADGTLQPREQDESLVTIAPKLGRADGWVDFTQTAASCRNRIHGLSPWPGVTASFRGSELKLLRARIAAVPQHAAPPGTLLDPRAGVIACGGGTSLALLEVQAPGKRALAWADFARGVRPAEGERLEGRAAQAEGHR